MAAKKSARGEQLTAAEWRERIYRDVPLKDVRRLLGGKTVQQVKDLATSTGLPIGGAKTDLFLVFAALPDFARKLAAGEQAAEAQAARESDGGRLICSTKFEAAAALKKAIGRGSVRMLTDWLSAGMPGDVGSKGRPGRFDIEAMVVWARENLDDLAVENEEASRHNLTIKREKARQAELATQEKERLAAEQRGDVLPRSEWTQFAHESITVARARLLAIPKEVASLVTDPDLQRKLVDEGTSRVTRILETLEKEFERGPVAEG